MMAAATPKDWERVIMRMEKFKQDSGENGIFGKMFGGGSKAREMADQEIQRATKALEIQASSGDEQAQNALNRIQVQKQVTDDSDFANMVGKIKRIGGSTIQPGGIAAPGATTAGGVGGTISAIGGAVPGPAGWGLQLVGGVLQVADKINTMAKAQLQSNFTTFGEVDPHMSAIQAQYETQIAAVERKISEDSRASTEYLAEKHAELKQASAPIDTFFTKA